MMITRIGSLASAVHFCLFEINLTTHDLAGLGLCLDMSLCLSASATGILLGINKCQTSIPVYTMHATTVENVLFVQHSPILSQGC